MPAFVMRALLGFIAAALSVVTFHAAMWELLHLLAIPGLTMPAPYPMDLVAPLGVPRIVSLCFWGGLYGIVFGLMLPRLTGPLWLWGLALGVLAMAVGLFIVPLFKGGPVGGGWDMMRWLRSLLINGFWGLGVALILPFLLARMPGRKAGRGLLHG